MASFSAFSSPRPPSPSARGEHTIDDVLSKLLGATEPIEAETASDFLRAVRDETRDLACEADRALVGGRLADRLGFAFAAGYHAALRSLLRGRAPAGTCLAATEEGGAHPRAIRATLTASEGAWALNGEKRWATLATESEAVLVFARTGEVDGRPQLRAALLPLSRAGITLASMPPTPFAPEIAHARMTLENVRVERSELLPGDAYDLYLKPFRTVEDAHVICAALGHLIGAGIAHGFERPLLERLVALALAARACATSDPTAASVHVALGGVLGQLNDLEASLSAAFDRAGGDANERWVRDRTLLSVASKARGARLEKAWDRLRA